MARQTSIAAYHKLRKSGALNKSCWRAYQYVYKNGPVIQNELKYDLTDIFSGLSPRCCELERMGLFKRVGHKVSEKTGITGELWDVTDRATPLTQVKKISRKKLEKENSLMKTMLRSIKFNSKCERTKKYIEDKLPK